MEKKTGKKVVALSLSMSMLAGQVASSMTLLTAQEESNAEDYSDTTRMRSVDTLDANDITVDKNFNLSPLYDIENNELLLPRIKGYKVEVFGSDNKATISLEGKVTRPLQTQTVKLLYKITNEADGTTITTETNAVVKIPAREVDVVGENAKPQVIPELREWVAGDGEIDLTDARIVLGTEKFRTAAENFKADYEDLTGRDIDIVIGDGSNLQKGDIFLGETADDTMLGDEGYYLNIGGDQADKDYVEIKATHNTGALYGTVSILQILKQDTSNQNDLPKGLIKDYPKFEQRGMMFDVARKWIPMEYLQDLTKQMTWYKLNMLSLHLSDNDIWNGLSTENGRNGDPEGWFRLESERFPELNQNSDGYDRGEYYTKEEFRNFQYSSMDLGIDVIPELDTPGHALAYTRAWEGSQRGDNPKYLDAKNPDNLEKVKELFSEYIEGYEGGEPTFVGEHVNIGTDEYKSGTATDKEAFRAYCDALLKHVKSLGKEPVFWGSLTENNGSTPVMSDATMFAWYQGYANAKQSLDAGYKIISMEDNEVYIVPGGGYYSNQFGRAEHLYNNWVPNKNTGWAGNNAPDGHPGVTGGQFAVWNDFAGNGISVQDISYRIQHNLYTIAQKTWAGTQAKDEGKSYDDVKQLANTLGDAPNSDFLYEIDETITNNEVIKLDDVAVNKITNGVDITGNVNVSENVEGKNENGLRFNGGTSYLTTELKSAGFGWTTSMWIKPAADGILMEGKTGTLRLENGKIKYDVENYTHTFDCNIENGKWTHIALTGTYEGVSLYIDGEKFDALIGKPFPNWNNNSGCNSWNGTYPTNDKGQRTQRYYETLMLPMEVIGSKENSVTASIDELNIYNKVLTDAEIAQLAGGQVSEEYENLALGKTVSASGQEDGTIWSADKVVDGDTTSNNSRWSSNYDDKAWLTVDLGKAENVNNIKIYWEAAYGIKYKVLVSEDNENWQEVYNEENGTGGIKDIKFAMKENIRYIKFQGVERKVIGGGKWGYSFYEMEVYGDKIAGDYERQNVALDKTVEVGNYHSASSEGDRSGSKAVDGDLDSRWEFDLNNTNTNFIKIPLANDEDVDKVVIKQMVWGGANRISKYRVVAVNGDQEVEILPEATYDGGDIDTANKIATKVIELGQTVKADAIKIYLTPKAAGADDLVNIREIELYGTKGVEDTPVDPEIKRNHTKISQSTMSASATSEHPNIGSEGLASMAIDNNTGTWWHTNWSNPVSLPQSITLDLHEIKTIGKYTYLPRSGGGNGTISKYTLETSTDGVNYTKVAEGTWEVNALEKTVEFAPTHARYIRLTALQGVGGFASAAELNVYQTEAKIKADLQQLVNEAENINLDNYLVSSTAKYLTAINDAKKLLEKEPSEAEISNASKAIQEGLKELDVNGDKSELTALYEANKDLNSADYVKESFDVLTKALEAAKVLIDSSEENGQKELDKAKVAINEAKEGLISIVELRNEIMNGKLYDVTDMTKESGEELQLRLNNAIKVIADDKATRNQVEIALYRLSLAIEYIEVDATALKDLISQLDHEEQYTVSSWATFVSVLDVAKGVVDSTEISVITNARLALDEAAKNLVVRADNEVIATLQELINEAEGLNSDDYTVESWQGYQALIDQARQLLVDPADVDQAAAVNLITEITTYQLIKKDTEDVNTTALEIAVDVASKISEAELENVAPAVVEEFKAALLEAQEILKNPTDQSKVDASFNRLAKAMHMLSFIKGDKTELIKLINKIDSLNSDAYTIDTWQAMVLVLEEAKKVADDENALKDDVNATYESLVRAFIDLRLKPNKDALNDLINKVNSLNKANYTAESWNAVEKALNEAKLVLADEKADEKAVMLAEANLKNTVASLVAINPIDTTSPAEVVKPGDTKKPVATKTGDDIALESFLLASGAALGATLIIRNKRKED